MREAVARSQQEAGVGPFFPRGFLSMQMGLAGQREPLLFTPELIMTERNAFTLKQKRSPHKVTEDVGSRERLSNQVPTWSDPHLERLQARRKVVLSLLPLAEPSACTLGPEPAAQPGRHRGLSARLVTEPFRTAPRTGWGRMVNFVTSFIALNN